jgi:putative cardiolipin synthase
MTACSQLPKSHDAEKSTAITGTEDTALGKRSSAVRREHPQQSRLIPLQDGVDAFYMRMALTEAAERSLDIQYFLWHKDLTGQILLKSVLDAADRGVRVRLLLDDLDNQELDQAFYALDTHENISIRLYNPFTTRNFKYIDFFTNAARLRRRMHNKSFTADNQYTIVGGRNIGDEYFDAQEGSNFNDMDVLATGPVVKQVSHIFDDYWNHATAVPVHVFAENAATPRDLENVRVELAEFVSAQSGSQYTDDIRTSDAAKAMAGGTYQTFYGDATAFHDDPDKGLGKPAQEYTSMADLMRPQVDKAKHEIVFISPYFVPGDRGVEWLVDKAEKGINVDVITNSYDSTDSGVIYAGYSRYRKPLLAGGVALYELKSNPEINRRKGSVASKSAASLHAKVFILDRESVFIGSLNLDPRSIDFNTEMGILIHSPELAMYLISLIEKGKLENAYELKLVRSPAESQGEFTTYTWDIEWIERVNGEIVRHTSEPGIDALDSVEIFFYGFVPESLT